jgi:hypothetical protein
VIQAEGVIEGNVPVAGPRANGLGIGPLPQQLRAGEVSTLLFERVRRDREAVGLRAGVLERKLVGAA